VAKVSQPIHLQAFSNLNHVDDNHGSSQEPWICQTGHRYLAKVSPA
jgi:hypothetical protein